MKRLNKHQIGITSGDVTLFSDFQHDGEMWSGTGPRERRVPVVFDEPFDKPPAVFTSVSLWDVDTTHPMRADLSAENITETGFEIVFRTWGDTRNARIRAAWQATGELPNDDDWQLY